MTLLDRLEALDWTAEDRSLYSFELKEVVEALPDLIRVARAAQTYVDGTVSHLSPPTIRDRFIEMENALAPLYREVES